MAKVTFSHDIEEDVVKIFENIYSNLGPPKYRILEAAIQTFASLPSSIQLILKACNESERKLCFDLMSKLQLHSEQFHNNKKAKSVKSG